MLLRRLGISILGLAVAGTAPASELPRAAWPNGPFVTSGRWITDASGVTVTYAGVNWPGHVETMIPEGLQYQSIETIVSKIKGIGINSIRMTYATEMVDEIEQNGGSDVPVRAALIDVLGQDNGTAVFQKILSNNPSFDTNTTRLQVFDAIAAESAKQEIYMHLDNHISKAGWCCSPLDGNAWWGDEYFSVANWTRGLSYMAEHGKQWPNLMSMSLRNELRQPLLDKDLYSDSYNWEDWYKYTQQGAEAIHSANSDVLIFLSGLDSDTTLQPVVQNTALTPGSATFSTGDFGSYADKLVLELHNYANILGGSESRNCTALQEDLFRSGFQALADDAPNSFPVIMTEYGLEENATAWQGSFGSCVEKYLAEQQAGWMIWVLAGSYYIREGTPDGDEPWGLLTHDWSEWRSPEHINGSLLSLIQATVSVNGTVNGTVQGNNTNSTGNGTTADSGAGARRVDDAAVSTLLLVSCLCLAGGVFFI